MRKFIFVFLPLFIGFTQANALVELRAGYGINTPSDDKVDVVGGSTLDLSPMSGFNLDAIVELPMVPFGFGLRYENMGMDLSTNGTDYSSDMERMAAIINYRFIDMFLYFGAIGTIGFSNSISVDISSLGTYKYDADLTYSAGVEGGVSLGLIMLGAEIGYNFAEYKAKDILSPVQTINADGLYGKVLVGVGF